MYKFAQILYKSCKNGNLENSFKSLLVEQSKALLITINALSLVDKKNQYLTIEVIIDVFKYYIIIMLYFVYYY